MPDYDDNKALVYVKEYEKREWLIDILDNDDLTIETLDAIYEDIDSLNNLDVTNVMRILCLLSNSNSSSSSGGGVGGGGSGGDGGGGGGGGGGGSDGGGGGGGGGGGDGSGGGGDGNGGDGDGGSSSSGGSGGGGGGGKGAIVIRHFTSGIIPSSHCNP
ncbi:PREDICTED: putative glycine-rich cell wall structural protein 1 [Atta colombica]|uniref:putative glycine-rich cell wall structural protein 1 n=1 Tax=Atta colombica TaxID=520822 RepID=UPI00084CA297|nr:PREDICTED: putative glycine-rich cell wall structural protein 1 [Atta colombica]